MSTVSVHPRYDEAQIADTDLQHILKAHIEKETGRRVTGPVFIYVKRRSVIGDPRAEDYVAQCELAPGGGA